MEFKLFFKFIFALLFAPSEAKTWLRADGNSSNTYNLVNSVLGVNSYEVPDCSHESFGHHITQELDHSLNVPVFAFHIHVVEDNDRCQKFDRQRVEIIVAPIFTSTISELKGYYGETVRFSWNFKLDFDFQASTGFTYIHQIIGKSYNNEALPFIAIKLRLKGRSRLLQITHHKDDSSPKVLKSDDLSLFAGTWIHACEELTYSRNGKYSLVLSRMDDGQDLMNVTRNYINLWRNGTQFMRPKWGIYRSLVKSIELRDEKVYFGEFCLAKGSFDKCA